MSYSEYSEASVVNCHTIMIFLVYIVAYLDGRRIDLTALEHLRHLIDALAIAEVRTNAPLAESPRVVVGIVGRVVNRAEPNCYGSKSSNDFRAGADRGRRNRRLHVLRVSKRGIELSAF